MLKVALVSTLLCCLILALIIYAIIRDDWLIYKYNAVEYEKSVANMPVVQYQSISPSSATMTATFSLWSGCMDVSWQQNSPSSYQTQLFRQQQQQQQQQDVCYDVLEYNDKYFEAQRDLLNLPALENITYGVTLPPTPAPRSLPSDRFRTGFVRTLAPTTPANQAAPNTITATGCPLPPDVNGASYEIDIPYEYDDISFSRTRYSCKGDAYALRGARDYTLQSFCVNGSWTVPPKCTPTDRCLPEGDHWDVCISGRAWDPPSIVQAIGGSLPINATNVNGHGLFLFPEFEIVCNGVIRQWDFYANVSGFVHLSVWKPIGNRYHYIAKNTVKSDGSGLQGAIIEPGERIFVRRGYIIGISYDNLVDGNNTAVVQVYNAVDIDHANPLLDWTKLQYSNKAIMAPVTQQWVESYLYIDDNDRSLGVKRIARGRPVVPLVAAYVTGAVVTPIRYKTVQALMVLAAIAVFLSVILLFVFIILLAKKKDNLLGIPIQAAIFLNLFSSTSGVNGLVLLLQEYDCNTLEASYGTAVFIAFGAMGLAAVSVILLCLVDRRLLTVLSRKQYKIVVKPPSAMA